MRRLALLAIVWLGTLAAFASCSKKAQDPKDNMEGGGAVQPAPGGGAATTPGESAGPTPDGKLPTPVKSIPPDVSPVEHDEDGRVVRVWFGTNRALINPKDPSKGFGTRSDIDDQLHLGSCVCFVPRSRPFGSLGSGWFTRVTSGVDDRIKIDQIQLDQPDDFYSKIAERLAAADPNERCILLYVHGYNNSFERAALRAAQLAVDLNVPGVTAFYSWPSQGDATEYSADEAAVETAERHLSGFLSRLAGESGATRVHIIAHSMGNRLLARVVQRLEASPARRENPIKFGQIILAAPDMDIAVFRDLAAAYPRLAEKTTLYISAKDMALEASAWKHSFFRAGYAPPIAILSGIDTVEVTHVDPSVLGHGYIAEAQTVMFDIAQMIRAYRPPDRRPNMDPAETPDGRKYWRLR